MTLSIQKLASGAYHLLLTKLRWLAQRYRRDDRAGTFWAFARQKAASGAWLKSQVQSQVYWFGPTPGSRVLVDLQESRFAGQSRWTVQSFEPPVVAPRPMLPSLK